MCLCVPEPFAKLIVNQLWSCLCVPSPYSIGWWRAPRWFRTLLSPNLKTLFEATQEKGPHALSNGEHFALPMTGELAQALRGLDLSGPGNSQQTRDDLQHWISRLQAGTDACESARGRQAKFEEIVHLMCLSDLLRDAGRLREVLVKACAIVFPGMMHDIAKHQLQFVQKLDKAQISRHRLTLDVSIMLWFRCRFHKRDVVRYMMWDSSPQYGRNYELAWDISINRVDLCGALAAFEELSVLIAAQLTDHRKTFELCMGKFHSTVCMLVVGLGTQS